jgi:Dimethlysulfonioproprionate lyase
MNASGSHGNLIALTQSLLESLAAPPLAPYLADWPESSASHVLAQPRSGTLPVLRWMPHLGADAHGFGAELVGAVCRAATVLTWQQTYTTSEVGAEFLQNYGWAEIFGERRGKGGGQVACGVLLLGPNTLYPQHRHEPEEIYLPLHGTANWQQGDAIWRERPPGTLIHHRSKEPHAMRTNNDPLLALYLWRGANLSHKAALDQRGAA